MHTQLVKIKLIQLLATYIYFHCFHLRVVLNPMQEKSLKTDILGRGYKNIIPERRLHIQCLPNLEIL